MNQNAVQVTIGGRVYTLLLNLSAYTDIQKRYGTLYTLLDRLAPSKSTEEQTDAARQAEAQKAVEIYGLTEIPQLVEILTAHSAGPVISAAEVADTVLPYAFPELTGAVMSAIAAGMHTEHRKTDKQDVDVVLEELEAKNAPGAVKA